LTLNGNVIEGNLLPTELLMEENSIVAVM